MAIQIIRRTNKRILRIKVEVLREKRKKTKKKEIMISKNKIKRIKKKSNINLGHDPGRQYHDHGPVDPDNGQNF